MENEAALFRALGDPIRLRIAVILARSGETCVCHIAGALEEPDFKISRHLTVLRAAGLVRARREGTWMHYSLSLPDSALGRLLTALLREGFEDHPALLRDMSRLNSACCR